MNENKGEMIIQISAFDTLFFRDAKPFSRGEETWADGIFPPSPSVFYGAIRSCYFSNNPNELKSANLENDPTKNLEITGIYLKWSENKKEVIFLPLPMDSVTRDERKNTAFVMTSRPVKIASNYKLKELFLLNEHVKSVRGGLIDDFYFKRYLEGDRNFNIKKISDFLRREPKVGIGRTNQTHAATNTMLYRVGMQRLVNTSFVISFSGLDIPESGMMKLGGENKAVHYKKTNNITISPNIKIDKRFKLVFTTPAIFEKGWIPKWLNFVNGDIVGDINGVKIRLINSVVGKPIYIGGFDLKASKPKKMYKAVPAGSVYYFEIEDGDPKMIVDRFNGKSISDLSVKEGFGIAYVGGIKT